MGALIGITNQASSNLLNNSNNNSNNELISLLKQKIEDSILTDKYVVAYISSPMIDCRNTIYIEDFEINEENLYINEGNYELHINLNEVEMKYDNSFDESFIIKHDDLEIGINFLE